LAYTNPLIANDSVSYGIASVDIFCYTQDIHEKQRHSGRFAAFLAQRIQADE
jgi:hypothetical protein